MAVYIADAVGKVLALGDKQSHKLGGIGAAHTQLGELLTLVEAFALQFVHIVDLAHRAYCKAPQVRVDDDRLRVGVADDTNAHIAGHLVKVFAELGAKVRVLDVVNV